MEYVWDMYEGSHSVKMKICVEVSLSQLFVKLVGVGQDFCSNGASFHLLWVELAMEPSRDGLLNFN